MKYYSRLFGEFFIYILMMIFLARLGFWQLHRAEEKKQILRQSEQYQIQPAYDWNAGRKILHAFEKIKLTGHPLGPLIYLDNQFYKHQLGYDVLLPVLLSNGKIVLIDYGWKQTIIRGQWSLEKLPDTDSWEGQVYFPTTAAFNLGNQIEYYAKRFVVVESLGEDVMAKLFSIPVEPWIIRLQKKDVDFVRDWHIVSVMPQRHYAYALQWFVMSGIVLIVFVWRVFKR